ncbi:M67 family metallopeptidase [bacterium]|nr:M67 family metallopeptidase [Candidatus Omnitrophota bacterium]MBU3929320.1 M67 family metallopeptidase [bacterium]MBU4122475.1 M67 family metallopeptidase [bacterium]
MKISKGIVEKIFNQGEKEKPCEACGYLAGRGDIIIKNYPMTNMDNSSEHFSLDPAEQFAVIRKIRQESLELIAVYHTHPETSARPSDEDIRLAFDRNIIYVIVSLATDKKDVKAFRVNKGQITEERLVIEEKN